MSVLILPNRSPVYPVASDPEISQRAIYGGRVQPYGIGGFRPAQAGQVEPNRIRKARVAAQSGRDDAALREVLPHALVRYARILGNRHGRLAREKAFHHFINGNAALDRSRAHLILAQGMPKGSAH